MTPVTIPLHLLIPTTLSLAGFTFLLLKRSSLRRKNPVLYKTGLIFFFSYALIVGNAFGHDLYYQWDLNRYDINRDGFFSPSEATPKQLLASERLANDTERNSSFVSALIVSGILSVGVYGVTRISYSLFGPEDNEDNIHPIHTT